MMPRIDDTGSRPPFGFSALIVEDRLVTLTPDNGLAQTLHVYRRDDITPCGLSAGDVALAYAFEHSGDLMPAEALIFAGHADIGQRLQLGLPTRGLPDEDPTWLEAEPLLTRAHRDAVLAFRSVQGAA